jgi:hypothetical protein
MLRSSFALLLLTSSLGFFLTLRVDFCTLHCLLGLGRLGRSHCLGRSRHLGRFGRLLSLLFNPALLELVLELLYRATSAGISQRQEGRGRMGEGQDSAMVGFV